MGMSWKRLLSLILVIIKICACGAEEVSLQGSSTCQNYSIDESYDPSTSMILCCLVPKEFILCERPFLLNSSEDEGYPGGCAEFGVEEFERVENVSVNCSILNGVVCAGDREFQDIVPCVRYGGHYFPTIMLYSVFLGFLGVDRFCLGYTCIGAAKLVTLGGIGVWWIVDIILLLTGVTHPNNGFNWEQFY